MYNYCVICGFYRYVLMCDSCHRYRCSHPDCDEDGFCTDCIEDDYGYDYDYDYED